MALVAQFSSEQQRLDVTVVRGDTFARKLFQVANEDDTPADLTGYEFAIQVRPAPRSSLVIVSIPDDYFLLGQSDDAVQYDIDEGNPAGTTKDEVHVNAPASLMRVKAGNWHWDIEVIDPGGDVLTPIFGRFEIKQDVTRISG
jgi:hypothetical protein